MNAQILLRGVPEDYDSWAAMGNDEWGYRKLLPYFRRFESDRSFGGRFPRGGRADTGEPFL